MTVEIEKAKEKFSKSTRAQVKKAAGVDLSADVIEDIIRNVMESLRVDTEQVETQTETTKFESVNTQTEGTVDVEKLQARVRTQEKVIEDQERNIREKEQELNELRLRNANDDVLNKKKQEINDLHELNAIREQYNEESKRDKTEAARKYWEGYRRANTEFKNIICVGEAKQKEIEDKFKDLEEKIKILKQAEIRKHNVPNPDFDIRSNEVGREGLSSIRNEVDNFFDRLVELDNIDEDTDPNDVEVIMNKLRVTIPGLEIMHDTYKQKSDRMENESAKAYYDELRKHTERKIDIIRMALDEKVKYPEAMEKLKLETENNYGTKFERLKNGQRIMVWNYHLS